MPGPTPVLNERLEGLQHARAHKGVRVAQALLQRVKEAARLCVLGAAGGLGAFTVAVARGGGRGRGARGLALVLLGGGLLAGRHAAADQVAQRLDHRHPDDVRLHAAAAATHQGPLASESMPHPTAAAPPSAPQRTSLSRCWMSRLICLFTRRGAFSASRGRNVA